MGIVFEFQANTAKQTVADEISPITLSNLNATYDQVKTGQEQYMAMEEPKIQAKQAAPSVTYNYYSELDYSIFIYVASFFSRF